MSTVHVAFQEGFTDDTVVVRVGDAEVFRRDAVKTRMQVGLAARHDVEVPAEVAELCIEVPSRDATVTVPLPRDRSGATYVAVSIAADGSLEYRVSGEPFRYA
jgi:hypothetical protein